MKCKELAQLIPEMVEGTLSTELQAEAEASLEQCPDCQRELEIARQVRAFLVELQAENNSFRVSPAFEALVLERVRRQSGGLDLLDLSAKTFGAWLIELLNLLGGLLDPNFKPTPVGAASARLTSGG